MEKNVTLGVKDGIDMQFALQFVGYKVDYPVSANPNERTVSIATKKLSDKERARIKDLGLFNLQ